MARFVFTPLAVIFVGCIAFAFIFSVMVHEWEDAAWGLVIIGTLALLVGTHFALLSLIAGKYRWPRSLRQLAALSFGTSLAWFMAGLAIGVVIALSPPYGTDSFQSPLFHATLALPLEPGYNLTDWLQYHTSPQITSLLSSIPDTEWILMLLFVVLPFALVLFVISGAIAWLLTYLHSQQPQTSHD